MAPPPPALTPNPRLALLSSEPVFHDAGKTQTPFSNSSYCGSKMLTSLFLHISLCDKTYPLIINRRHHSFFPAFLQSFNESPHHIPFISTQLTERSQ
jgi:hypothetical protein